MAENDPLKPSEAQGENAAETVRKKDTSSVSGKEVAPWLKNLGAGVTIFAALAGLCFTAYQLKVKADADEETARLNRDSEINKLKLGEEQLQDQKEARKMQADQHAQDAKLEIEKHTADIKQQDDVARLAVERNERERLETIVRNAFSKDGDSEAAIASLSIFINRSSEDREIVENAVLAKLSFPKTAGEIELGYQLLEEAGPTALEYIVRANRVARQRYDSLAITQFYLAFSKYPSRGDDPHLATSPQNRASSDVLKNVVISSFYVNYLLRFAPYGRENAIDADTAASDFRLAQQSILRSNSALEKLFGKWDGSAHSHVNFDDTYLIAFESEKASASAVNNITATYNNTVLDMSRIVMHSMGVKEQMEFLASLFYTRVGTCVGLLSGSDSFAQNHWVSHSADCSHYPIGDVGFN